MSKPRILFVVEAATLAHVVRSKLLANALSQATYEVIFACDKYFEYALQDANFKIVKLHTRTPQELENVLSRGGCLFDYNLLSQYVSEELELFDSIKPDLVIGDFRPSLAVSCPAKGITFCNLTNAYWSPFAQNRKLPFPCLGLPEKFGLSGYLAKGLVATLNRIYSLMLPLTLRAQARGLDQLRCEFGFEPFSDYYTGFTFGDHVLYADLPEIVATKNLPENHHFIGPITWAPSIGLPTYWDRINKNRDLVYLSLGSSGSLKALELLVNALSKFPVEVVVATAGRKSFNNEFPNVYCSDFLPGDKIVQHAQLVIANGGSPGIYQALKAGVPVLSIPTNMDQLLASLYAERAGVGLTIRSDLIDADSVFQATELLLSNKAYQRRAQFFSQLCKKHDPFVNLNLIIEKILNSGSVYERVQAV